MWWFLFGWWLSRRLGSDENQEQPNDTTYVGYLTCTPSTDWQDYYTPSTPKGLVIKEDCSTHDPNYRETKIE